MRASHVAVLRDAPFGRSSGRGPRLLWLPEACPLGGLMMRSVARRAYLVRTQVAPDASRTMRPGYAAMTSDLRRLAIRTGRMLQRAGNWLLMWLFIGLLRVLRLFDR